MARARASSRRSRTTTPRTRAKKTTARRGSTTTRSRSTTSRRTGGRRSATAGATRRSTSRGSGSGGSKRRTAPQSELRSRTVGEVMSAEPVAMVESDTIAKAARLMKEHDIGDVIVLDDTSARLKGIVTDRDIVVRVIAEERNPEQSTIGSIASEELSCVTPEDTVDDAIKLMRRKAVRRVPVVEDGHAVGIVSIGDLAERFDERSALADISSAPANT